MNRRQNKPEFQRPEVVHQMNFFAKIRVHKDVSRFAPVTYGAPSGELVDWDCNEFELQQYLARVYGYHQQTKRMFLDWKVRLGAILIQVRAQRPYGTWRAWLNRMAIHYKTAQRCIQLAERLADSNGDLDTAKLKALMIDEKMRHKIHAEGGDVDAYDASAMRELSTAQVEIKLALRKRHNMQTPRLGGGDGDVMYTYAGRNATPRIRVDGETVQERLPMHTRNEYAHCPSLRTIQLAAGGVVEVSDKQMAVLEDALKHSINTLNPETIHRVETVENPNGPGPYGHNFSPTIRRQVPVKPLEPADNSRAFRVFEAGIKHLDGVFRQVLTFGELSATKCAMLEDDFKRYGKQMRSTLLGEDDIDLAY
jgi:hypothetical protein